MMFSRKITWHSIVIFSIIMSQICFAASSDKKIPKEEKFNPPKNVTALSEIVDKVQQEEIRHYLTEFLQQTFPTRLIGTPGQVKAPDVIMTIVKGIVDKLPPSATTCCTVGKETFTPDLVHARKIYENDFEQKIVKKYQPSDPTYKKWKGFTDDTLKFLRNIKVEGNNVVWERKGAVDPDSVLILGAHFDSMAHDPNTLHIDVKAKAQGADDNASGVAVGIALIKLLSTVPLPKTVRIVFYDFGQIGGGLGALAHAKKNAALLKSPKFAGHVDMIMLGYDTRDRDTEKKYGNMIMYLRDPADPGGEASGKLGRLMREAGKRNVHAFDFAPVIDDFDQADGSAYWEYGVPTVVFTQNWDSDMNPNYHTNNDFAETLNYQTLYKSYEFIASGVLAWAFDLTK